jgi:2-C-methyl-D-erythritol 4-phosphate cytidylyltransferase
MRYWLVMPAAGAGRRFGGRPAGERVPKQYAALRGRTVIEWSLAPFLADSRCAGAVVALAADDKWWPKVAERIPAVTVCQGGAERSESVRNALAALNRRAGKDDWVLVHDAARPCLVSADLDRLLERVGAHAVGGILAQPVADTLKRASGGVVAAGADSQNAASADSQKAASVESRKPAGADSQPAGGKGSQSTATSGASGSAGQKANTREAAIEQTVDRAGLWRAGTPQMFRYARLLDALEKALAARRFPTDEAQALEWLGEHPLLVEGSAANLKVTTADDLALAESLLAGREARGK